MIRIMNSRRAYIVLSMHSPIINCIRALGGRPLSVDSYGGAEDECSEYGCVNILDGQEQLGSARIGTTLTVGCIRLHDAEYNLSRPRQGPTGRARPIDR